MPSKLFIRLAIGIALLFTVGCFGSRPETKVVYRTKAIICPPEPVICDCSESQDPREQSDLVGLQIESLNLFEIAKCLEDCDYLDNMARELCEEQIEVLNDKRN